MDVLDVARDDDSSPGSADPGDPRPGGGLDLQDFLCFALYSASHAFAQFYRPHLDELGLTYPQYLAMVALWSRDDRTVGELGAALSLDSSTLTPLLKRLEARGYVARSRDPRDERQVRVRLTAGGADLRDRAAALPARVAEAAGLSPDELARMVGEVARIRARLLGLAGPPQPG